MLIASKPDAIEVSPAFVFELNSTDYRPSYVFEQHYFREHAFDLAAAMNGEESECAAKIDGHANVKRWVRNADRETQGGFCLPKSPGMFFPDFLAELLDGTIVLIEYKMLKMAKDDEEQHKKTVGQLWESRSAGKCRFAWIVDRDWGELERKLC